LKSLCLERVGLTSPLVRGSDGRDAGFDPVDERGERIEAIDAEPTDTMEHAGNHDKAKEIVWSRSHRVADLFVIRHGAKWVERCVRPTEIADELAASLFETGEVRVDRMRISRMAPMRSGSFSKSNAFQSSSGSSPGNAM